MGVRFACHACGKRLNIKTELAGRRGICPACSVRFRIPAYDTEFSTPVQVEQPVATAGGGGQEIGQGVGVSSTSAAAVADRPTLRVAPTNTTPQTNTPQTNTTDPTRATDTPQSRQPVQSRPSFDETLGGASATWYVRPPTGGQFGPADGPTMGQWMKEGRVAQTAMVWRDGWTDWKLASDAIPDTSVNGTENQIGPVGVPAMTDDSSGSDASQKSNSEQVIRANRGALGSNKKKRSKNRVVASVLLGLIFLALLVALVLVVQRS